MVMVVVEYCDISGGTRLVWVDDGGDRKVDRG